MTDEQREILIHTAERAAGHLYYGDSAAMQGLVTMGFMEFVGEPGFCEDKVFTWTTKGEVWYHHYGKVRKQRK